MVRPERAMRLINGLLMRDAALAGLGITLLPRFVIHRELAAGTLVELSIEASAQAEGAEIYLAYPGDRPATAKLKAFAARLRQCIGRPAYREQG